MQLPGAIDALLQAHPAGLSEFELIKALREDGRLPAQPAGGTPPLLLFQLHFLVFHCLYRLRDRHWQRQSGCLHISALNIRLAPYTAGQASLTEADPLRDYYLDLANLLETGEQDVADLLSHFWLRLDGQQRRHSALATLGLEADADFTAIKQRYRKLVMQHHPDRGGDKAMLQTINEAMAWLEDFHRNER